jgi:oxygen-dependent protoporphyrinogen oxidase
MTRRVAIVGAGITGLVCAHELERAGIVPTVFEASDRAGGPIQTVRRDGFLAERGPHTIMDSNPTVGRLIEQLGLTEERVYATDASKKRFMVRDHQPKPLPMGPGALFKTDALSRSAKFALLREPFVARRDDGVDESVTNFVTRRLNRELLDYGLELLVNGVWAGDPNRLSVRYAFGKMAALERDYGSLIKGGIARARQGRNPDARRMLSFREGNQTLSDALANSLSDLRLGSTVRKVRRTGETWKVSGKSFDDVVLTVGANVYNDLLELDDDGPIETQFFEDVAYPSVTIVTVGFHKSQVPHPLDGFGMIAPMREKLDFLGALFTSTLFAGRAPRDHVTLACFVGGMRRRDLAALSETERLDRTMTSLRTVLGITGDPVFVEQAQWERAIPQYEVGYGRLLAQMEALERGHEGLWIAGNIRQGVAVPDLIEAGAKLAETLARPS